MLWGAKSMAHRDKDELGDLARLSIAACIMAAHISFADLGASVARSVPTGESVGSPLSQLQAGPGSRLAGAPASGRLNGGQALSEEIGLERIQEMS
jgi:hypothetical protein